MHGAMGNGEMSVSKAGICTRRKRLLECLAVEQHILETMVVDLFNKGKNNLGTEQTVLEQSRKLDKLVIDEMLLEEMISRTK